MSATADQILRLVMQLLEGHARIERQIEDLAAHVDEIDRTLRPYGDGTRDPRPRGRRR